MPKVGFYAVKKGYKPGVYSTWEECERNVKGFNSAAYKKFKTLREAEEFVGVPHIVTSATRPHLFGVMSPSPSNSIANLPTPATRSSSLPKPYERPNGADPKEKARATGPSSTSQSEWRIVYTDGACKGNGKRGSVAGIGVWWGANDPRNLSERCPGDQTNNRAELIAIIRALETDADPTEPLEIRTDSRYSISCVKDWIRGWIKKGWRNSQGQPVKNKAVIQHLAKILDDRPPGTVRLKHVKGHSGEVGNEGADRLAVAGTQYSPLLEREWIIGDGPTGDSPTHAQPLASVEVESEFMLTDEEMERMAREQVFD